MTTSLVAADCGKSTTKICLLKDGTLLKDSFPTAYGLASDGRSDLIDKAHTFSIEGSGKAYRIGSGALPIKADDSYSKDSEITKVCALYGIAKNVSPGDTVAVAIGCPLTSYMNLEARKQYCKNILPKETIKCSIDDKPTQFTIEKRIVFPESTGVITLHPELFTGENDIGIIDIGGLNMNVTVLDHGEILDEMSHTTSNGGRRLSAEVKTLLRDHEIEIEESQVLGAIQRGRINCHDEKKAALSESIIATAVNGFIDRIDETLHQTWRNFDTLTLCFIGGTSYLLKDALTERYGKFAIFENDLEQSRFANAEGFVRRLETELAKLNKQK